jgi:hypothetical protein
MISRVLTTQLRPLYLLPRPRPIGLPLGILATKCLSALTMFCSPATSPGPVFLCVSDLFVPVEGVPCLAFWTAFSPLARGHNYRPVLFHFLHHGVAPSLSVFFFSFFYAFSSLCSPIFSPSLSLRFSSPLSLHRCNACSTHNTHRAAPGLAGWVGGW